MSDNGLIDGKPEDVIRTVEVERLQYELDSFMKDAQLAELMVLSEVLNRRNSEYLGDEKHLAVASSFAQYITGNHVAVVPVKEFETLQKANDTAKDMLAATVLLLQLTQKKYYGEAIPQEEAEPAEK